MQQHWLPTSASASKTSGTLAEYVVADRNEGQPSAETRVNGVVGSDVGFEDGAEVFAHRAAVTMRRTAVTMSLPASPRKIEGKGKERE